MMAHDFSDPYEKARWEMVSRQIESRGIANIKVLDVMRSVPRHLFVPEDYRSSAYQDSPLPIGENQTISQPYIVALMTSLLGPEPHETVLEIGTGSGYQAAVLSQLAKMVDTVERHEKLAHRAASVLRELDYHNVSVHIGDGSLGWRENAPYDAIMVTAAAPEVPQPLLQQLAEGGRLVIPVGPRFSQVLQIWEHVGGRFDHTNSIPVSFVPLRGEKGWSKKRWTR